LEVRRSLLFGLAMKMTNVRAVLFDLDGTLLPMNFDAFLARYLDRLGRWYRAALGVDVMAPMMEAAMMMMQNDGSLTNADLFWSLLLPKVGGDRSTLEQIYLEFVEWEADGLGEGITSDTAAPSVVRACRALGKKVALATNPIFPLPMIATRARWAGVTCDDFDLVTSSERMGFCKPATGYYSQLVRALDLAPNECLMIGNDVAMDLMPAAAIGMRTCLLTSEHTVLADRPFQADFTCALADVPALFT
jgi:FMN phosphatase YigB (HAD superfamily)